jgi:hypothetical protein
VFIIGLLPDDINKYACVIIFFGNNMYGLGQISAKLCVRPERVGLILHEGLCVLEGLNDAPGDLFELIGIGENAPDARCDPVWTYSIESERGSGSVSFL